jgi:hypothetical protein
MARIQGAERHRRVSGGVFRTLDQSLDTAPRPHRRHAMTRGTLHSAAGLFPAGSPEIRIALQSNAPQRGAVESEPCDLVSAASAP